MSRRPALRTFALLLVAALAGACGGGGGPTGPGEAQEVTGSSPAVLPLDDPGAPSDPSPLDAWVAIDRTADFELTLSLADPVQGPLGPGVPTYPSNQPIGVLLTLQNLGDQAKTFTVTSDPIFHIGLSNEETGMDVFPILTPTPPYPVTFAPNERRDFGRTWLPGGFPLGRYRVEGRIATTDVRIPGTLRLVLDVE